jgi:hypothetical protein
MRTLPLRRGLQMAKVCARPEEIVKDFRKSFGVSVFRSTGETGVRKLIRDRGAGAWRRG